MLSTIENDDLGKLILRLTVGGLMLFHGVAKVMKPGTVEYIGDLLAGYGIPGIVAYAVYIGEIVAPIMLIAGFQLRLGALLIVVNMIVAIALMHSGDLFGLTEHGGWRLELQGFYLFGALAVMYLGAGRYAMQPD
jgi:putative oxidoreductase